MVTGVPISGLRIRIGLKMKQQMKAPRVMNTAAVYGLQAPGGTSRPAGFGALVALAMAGAHEPMSTPEMMQTAIPLVVGTAPAVPRDAYAIPIRTTASSAMPTPAKSSFASPAGWII